MIKVWPARASTITQTYADFSSATSVCSYRALAMSNRCENGMVSLCCLTRTLNMRKLASQSSELPAGVGGGGFQSPSRQNQIPLIASCSKLAKTATLPL